MTDDLDGRTALVTGGSSGFGVDIAHELAERGADIVLVARREQQLGEVADTLTDEYGVESDWISKDLAHQEAGAELYDEVDDRGHTIDILVNNAGFGIYGEFLDQEWGRQQAMLNLNMMTPVRLTQLYADEMVDRGWGRIMQVASIGAYQPSPTFATYSATKSFLLSWGEALDYELEGTGVSCTVVSPGVARTEFHDRTDQEMTWYQKLSMMESSTVAAIGVRAMLNQRMSIVPGVFNALSVWMVRFLPRRLVRWVAYQTMRND